MDESTPRALMPEEDTATPPTLLYSKSPINSRKFAINFSRIFTLLNAFQGVTPKCIDSRVKMGIASSHRTFAKTALACFHYYIANSRGIQENFRKVLKKN
jgi:hypothetical protein